MLILFIFLSLLALTIYLTILSDKLLRIQYSEFKDSWLEQGKPRGMLFKPAGSSLISYWKISFRKLEDRFFWVKGHPIAETIYSRYRTLNRIHNYALLLFLPLIFLILIVERLLG